MSVVNVKVKYLRPKYNNLKEWMEDSNNVYIGRAGIVFVENERFPKTASKFCNPFKIGKDGTREEVVEKYEEHIRKIATKEEILELKNKNLGCWCKPESCHGDILLKLIEEYEK